MSGSSHLKIYLCAWCNRELSIRPGKLRGDPATNYGMCATCLVVQLPQLPLRPQPHLGSESVTGSGTAPPGNARS